MSDALSFAEIESQQVELLPARTVLSVVAPCPPPGTLAATGAAGTGLGGGSGGTGGCGIPGLGSNLWSGAGASAGTGTGGVGGAGGSGR